MTPASRSLLRAASDGDASLVRALLAQGIDINSTTAAGQTPLMLAAAFGHNDIVSYLLKMGADVELQDELGLTAMNWASGFPGIGQLISASQSPVINESVIESVEGQAEDYPLPASTDVLENNVVAQSSLVRGTSSSEAAPKPVTISAQGQQTDGRKPMLGGLAGAILRDRAAKGTDEETVDTTLSGLRNSADSVPEAAPSLGGPTLSKQSSESLSNKSNRPSKVEVEVPSFGQMRESASARPMRWVIRIIVLVVVALVSYRVSIYLLRERSTDAAPTASQTQATKPGVIQLKSSPVIGGGLEGTEVFVPDAEYPVAVASESQPGGLSGKVTVVVQVNQKGVVVSAKAVDGDERLRVAAVQAGKKAAFSPEKIRGKGRLVTGTITYSFVAPQQLTQSTIASASNTPLPGLTTSSPTTDPAPTAQLSSNSNANLPTLGGPLLGTEENLVQPEYPTRAKNRGIGGTVTILLRVNRQGKVVSWRTLEGDNQLRTAALKAAKQSTFSPTKLPGNGDVVGTITYAFKL